MTELELYRTCDQVLGPFLSSKGFRIARPAEYKRRLEAGEDRILVSRGPGNKAKTDFAIFMSYYPNYMEILDDLFGHLDEPKGFPCGPYLNPVGVTRRPKYWSYKDPTVLSKSLEHVSLCLEQAGLPWLETLRDPKVFADSVDPVAALPAALANEIAGNIEKAKSCYEEMLRRYRLVIQNTKDQAELLRTLNKAFVFVTIKLGVEQQRREEFQRKLNFYLNIKPLEPPG